ncbi:MAG TPA: glycosyltransferase family 39 protein [Vicinamibacteria bacterium]|nr:glycosyltransferase family 39 protein [Vicinamibacteria bacterium]
MKLGRPVFGALLWLPLAKALLHTVFAPGYGYYRDEFYYRACADHLAWGYVDHPPLSILLLWIVRLTLGDSLFAIRLLPAIVGALTVLLTGLIARELGGGRFAQTLAMLCTLIAPEYLAIDSVYSMNTVDLLVWTGSGYLLVRVLKEDRPGWWLALGVLLGLGLLNKISILWLGFGLGAGLLLSRRDVLRRSGPWMAASVAALLFLPHVLWQIRDGWPTLEFIRNATGVKMAAIGPMAFTVSQIQNQHPLTFPVWLAGLFFFLSTHAGRPFRPLGIIYLAVFLLLVVNQKSRTGYLAPAYSTLFAAGGVAIGRVIEERRWRVAPRAVLITLFIAGVVTAPLALPILPVESYIAYAQALGQKPSTEEKKEVGALPQFFADMQGWEEMVAVVARVYRSLSAEEQAKVGIFTSNYGEAGAIDLLGRPYGLPRAISGHNNYWLWGPRGFSGELMIMLTPSRTRLEERFESVEQAGTIECGHCMPYENHRPVFLCRRARVSLPELWPMLKHYD